MYKNRASVIQFRAKVLLATIYFISFSLETTAQKNIPGITVETWKVPLRQTNGKEIEGYKITATNPIQQMLIDSLHEIAYLMVNKGSRDKLSNNGYLMAFDIKANKCTWNMDVSFNSSSILLADSILIINDGANCYAVDHRGSPIIWSKSFFVHTLSPDKRYAIAASSKTARNVMKVEISSGKVIWNYTTNHIGDLEKARFFGDSLLLISANGLYYIPLSDGKGWRQKANTGVPVASQPAYANAGMVVGAVLAGVLLGMMGAPVIIIPTGPTPITTGNLQDNYLISDNMIYLAATDKFLKISSTGEVLLEMENPFKSVSVPKLFEQNGAIYAAANGIARNSDGQMIHSTAFVAKYSAESYTWDKIYTISREKRDFVNDYLVTDSSIVFACTNRMLELRLSDLGVIKEQSFGNQTTNVGLKDIVPPPGYITNDSIYLNTDDLMPGHIFIENTAKMKIEFDTGFKLASVITKANFYKLVENQNGLSHVSNGMKSDFIDSNNKPVFDFSFSNNAMFYGKTIIDIQENEGYWISLTYNK